MIAQEFQDLESQLGIFDKLSAFTTVIKAASGVENKAKNGYYLLILNTEQKTSSFVPFASDQAPLAEHMERTEKDNPSVDVVLAAAGDLKDLRTAYPNYFVDTKAFMSHLSAICSEILAS